MICPAATWARSCGVNCATPRPARHPARTAAERVAPKSKNPEAPSRGIPDFCADAAGRRACRQPQSDDACGFEQTNHSPGLVAGDRTTFCDFDEVALVVLVGFVVRLVARGTHHDLAKHGVLDATFYVHHHGLVHLVADDATNEGALALGRCSGLGFAHVTFLPSQP